MPRWVAWTFLTLVSWGLWAILTKLHGGGISDAQLQVLSTLGVLPILAALWFMPEPGPATNRRRGVLLALGAGIVSCIGNVAYYAALGDAKAATVIPLTALYPVVTVILAVPLLKERVNAWQWFGIVVSLSAIYLFNVPTESGVEQGLTSRWMLLPLTAIVLWGVAALMQKAATNDVSARESAIWFLLAFLPVAGIIQLYDPLPSGIPTATWWLAAALGFALAFGNLTILLAFASGDKASIIVPLAGLYPVVSIPIALVALGDRIGWRESCGIVLALTAVVLLSIQSDPEPTPAVTANSDNTL
jgi:drug/metabolite transporter (DMT)-like permease